MLIVFIHLFYHGRKMEVCHHSSRHPKDGLNPQKHNSVNLHSYLALNLASF